MPAVVRFRWLIYFKIECSLGKTLLFIRKVKHKMKFNESVQHVPLDWVRRLVGALSYAPVVALVVYRYNMESLCVIYKIIC